MSINNGIEEQFESINCNSFKAGDVVIRTGNGLAGVVTAFNPTDPTFHGFPSVDVDFVDGTSATVANGALRRA